MTGFEWKSDPFFHTVLDDFFPLEVALKLEEQFPHYDDPSWYYYNNAIENKKTLNLWHLFPKETYAAFQELCQLEINGARADFGLHGGGWHIHKNGGNLNLHLDYEIHPKLRLQRKYNLIIFLSSDFKPEYGGHLGLWKGNERKPLELAKTIEPKFNRAVLFDTTQNSWHGLATPIKCPEGVYRKSLAVYYLQEGDGERERALFAPREDQKNNEEILSLIDRRTKGEYR